MMIPFFNLTLFGVHVYDCDVQTFACWLLRLKVIHFRYHVSDTGLTRPFN
jgi:hypothetical protein